MMQRPCNAKIVATLGPASADRATIEALARAGADEFRLNFSHGTHADHKQRLDLIRSIETDIGRPIGVRNLHSALEHTFKTLSSYFCAPP
jgi:pyruvate kinase